MLRPQTTRFSSCGPLVAAGVVVALLLVVPQTEAYGSFPATASMGQTLYVGGSGPENYTTIQGAIDAAASGDTVVVFDDSAPYFEHLSLERPLTLRGERAATTVIDGSGTGDVIRVGADQCLISGFTVQHSGATSMADANIELRTSQSTLKDCLITESGTYGVGVFFNGSDSCSVLNCTITGNGLEGIFLLASTNILISNNTAGENGHCSVVVSRSSHNRITANTFYANHDAAVSLWPNSTDNDIDGNLIVDCPFSGIGIWPNADRTMIHDNVLRNNSQYGILLTGADGTVIEDNELSGSGPAILLRWSNDSRITRNTFCENQVDAAFENASRNRFFRNYWERHPYGILPVIIRGTTLRDHETTPWVAIDWRPVNQPYPVSETAGAIN